MINDKISAGKHFGFENWHWMKKAAFDLAMDEMSQMDSYWDTDKLHKIATKWNLGDAISFYYENPTLR
jgi:hypothetical protein